MDETLQVDLSRVAHELSLNITQVKNTVSLLDEGNTIPFITRYRKESTGNLDEVQIERIEQRVTALRQLAERAQAILRLIENQGKLTGELRKQILQAETLKRLEDLYLPFRPKRRSRALVAREQGLEPLGNAIWGRESAIADLELAAREYIDPAKSLTCEADVLRGAGDIIAERISETPEIRERTRSAAWKRGKWSVSASKTGEESGREFQDYFDFRESISRIPHHRALAINRGEKLGALKIRFEWDDAQSNSDIDHVFQFRLHRHSEFMLKCAADALSRLVQPSLEREIRREITERAESHAVSVFAKNLRALLLQAPLQGRRLLAIDPGFRTGCKVVILDECGNRLEDALLYVTGTGEKRAANREKLSQLAARHRCDLIAIGNGTACRETEELISEVIAESGDSLQYVIVNEAGASIYSTSTVARDEFPELDATVRGTISIGRRLQDPLSELVKLDPQHIGVGMYQHDLSAKDLKESLNRVVDSCVNFVGVDLNTASVSLLKHVSGLTQPIARRVVERRDKHGPFQNRQQLREVAGVGDVTFTQAAGFLKIQHGDEPLDGTWIHPESYPTTYKLLDKLAISSDELISGGHSQQLRERLSELDIDSLADHWEVGRHTLHDIVEALERPGRDPRTDWPGVIFKQGILKLEDLKEGLELKGTVLNVVDFGAFVDIGIKDSGLVHISKMSREFLKSPHEKVAVGDVITVWVLSIDYERRRVSLTMIPPGDDDSTSTADQQRRDQPAAPRRNPPKPQPDSEEQTAGSTLANSEKGEPLTGFDQLKQVWDSRKH